MRYLMLASFSLLAACGFSKKAVKGADGSDGNPSFSYTTWQLSSIPGFELEETPQPVTITFIDSTKRIGGNAGCNSFGGNYTKSGNALRLENIFSTKKACMPGMKTENKFMTIMMETDGYELDSNTLKLRKGNKVVAELKKAEK